MNYDKNDAKETVVRDIDYRCARRRTIFLARVFLLRYIPAQHVVKMTRALEQKNE
jgi:hypothetical protein